MLQGVRFLQLSPGEFFFTTLKVGGYAGLLIAVPTILYEVAAYVVPGLTKSERQFLAPVIFGSSILFYAGYAALRRAAWEGMGTGDGGREIGSYSTIARPALRRLDPTCCTASSPHVPPPRLPEHIHLPTGRPCRLVFSYEVLTPAALNFFVSYADGAVESLWSIDQYFEFVLVLMLSTGLSFQVCAEWGAGGRGGCQGRRAAVVVRVGPRIPRVDGTVATATTARRPPSLHRTMLVQVPVIQIMLGQLGLVSSQAMFSQWRYVVVGATIAAAVLTPSTDPFTQTLLALPLIGLYMGGAGAVRLLEQRRDAAPQA